MMKSTLASQASPIDFLFYNYWQNKALERTIEIKQYRFEKISSNSSSSKILLQHL